MIERMAMVEREGMTKRAALTAEWVTMTERVWLRAWV